MPMKVILLQEIAGLGTTGDVKNVADGYARNYLLPRQMVTAATPAAMATLQERIAIEKRRHVKERSDLESLAEQLKQITLTFQVRVGGHNRLYGSITTQNIAAALHEQNNIIIDRRTITLPDTLRALGTYKVPIRLSPGLEPEITVALVGDTEE